AEDGVRRRSVVDRRSGRVPQGDGRGPEGSGGSPGPAPAARGGEPARGDRGGRGGAGATGEPAEPPRGPAQARDGAERGWRRRHDSEAPREDRTVREEGRPRRRGARIRAR